MNGGERYFNTINLQIVTCQCSHGPVVKNCTFVAGGSCGAGSNLGEATSSFFFFHRFFTLVMIVIIL